MKKTKSKKAALTSTSALENVKVSGKSSRFPIIAMGGSAGSIQAFELFFKNTSNYKGYAFIIVMHLSSEGNINVPGLFQRFTSMPVVQVTDGMQIMQGHVYIIPPNQNMGIHHNKLLLFNLTKETGIKYVIDFFLKSLAEERWERAIAVISRGWVTMVKKALKRLKRNWV
jgi:two-component system CheB/CheR fusion protein